MAHESDLARLTPLDRKILTQALRDWIENDVERPHIPILDDIPDENGIVHAWALDDQGRLTVIDHVELSDTVFASTGEEH